MKDVEGIILYIGKAKLLSERIKQYFSGHDTRAMIPFLLKHLDRIETIITATEKEALLLENTLIKKHQPKYNILLKDDKTFISLTINNKHKWPQLKLIRYKDKGEGLYFGPYTSALQARSLFETTTKIFPLRQCSDRELASRKRPCLLYSIKRCIAPCVNKCTKGEYDETVKEAVSFLNGKTKTVVTSLKKKMDLASKELQFEKAGAFLKMIKQIEKATDSNTLYPHLNADAINFIRKGNYTLFVKLLFREGKCVGSEHFDFSLTLETDEEILSSFLLQHYTGQKPDKILIPMTLPDIKILEEILATKISVSHEDVVELALENAKALYEQEHLNTASKEELLLELQETLKLSRFPSRIECFDTSHISGSDSVASLAAFTDGQKDPSRSRLYKVQTENDDYASLKEILTRRLKKTEDLPDLIIVDGGKGQLNIAIEVCKELKVASVDIISLAKEDSRHDKGLTKERIFLPHKHEPIALNPHSPLHFFLQTIRDEAHRKAITYHRKKRAKRITHSLLDDLPGIGPVKKKRLLKHFGSVKRILSATPEELLEHISQKDVDTLLN